jgi:hypothetical protein
MALPPEVSFGSRKLKAPSLWTITRKLSDGECLPGDQPDSGAHRLFQRRTVLTETTQRYGMSCGSGNLFS